MFLQGGPQVRGLLEALCQFGEPRRCQAVHSSMQEDEEAELCKQQHGSIESVRYAVAEGTLVKRRDQTSLSIVEVVFAVFFKTAPR